MKTKSTIQGFINKDEAHKKYLLIVFKAKTTKTYKNKNVDIQSLFQQAKSQNAAISHRRRVLSVATGVASEKLTR